MFASGSVYAQYTPNSPIVADHWIDIRSTTSNSNKWRISHTNGDILSFSGNNSTRAELSLHVNNTSAPDSVGKFAGFRHGTNFSTQIGLKDEQGKWLIRSDTNLGATPQLFQTQFFSDGTVIAGFYGANLGIGTNSPAEKLHVAGRIKSSVLGSAFGNHTTGYEPDDGLFVGSQASNSNIHALSARARFVGNTSVGSTYTGVNGVATTGTESAGVLTSVSTGGGLKNRFSVINAGTSSVTQSSAVTASTQVNASAGGISNSANFHSEPPSVAAGTSIGSHHGLWVRGGTASGTIGTHYGVRVDALQSGADTYGVYVASDPTFLGGTVTLNGEVSGAGVTTTSSENKLVKTNSSGKIDGTLFDFVVPANVLTTTGDGSQLSGITKIKVGLGNVDNTSDAQKNAAAATLTNKALSGVDNQFSNIPQSAITNLSTDLANKANSSVAITVGTGLTGGGNLSSGFAIGLDPALIASIAAALPAAGNGSQLSGVVHGWADLLHVNYDEPTNSLILLAPDSTNALGVGTRTLWGNWTATGTLNLQGAMNLPTNIRQTFRPGATVAGLNVGTMAGNPTSAIAGDIWYNTTSGRFSGTFGTAVHALVGEGLTQTLTNKTISGANNTISNLNAGTVFNTGVVPVARGGAGNITGLLKANGLGVVSEAVAGQDYVVPTALNAKVDKTTTITAQNGITATGNLTSGVVLELSPATISALNNTNLNAGHLTSGTVSSDRGGAGSITGLLKANGSGVVSEAVPGTDYLTPAAANLLVPKTTSIVAGAGIDVAGDLSTSVTIALSSTTLAALANAGSGGLAPNGDGSGLSGITATQVNALSASGGTVDGDVAVTGSLTAATIVSTGVIRVAPAGNLSMGIFTAGTNPNPALAP